MKAIRFLFIWPLANIRDNKWISVVSVLGVGVSAFFIATLLGFVSGYQEAAKRDVDRLGYDLLITAKGCPYEAATLMLRGGVGLKYMPGGVVSKLENEPHVTAVFPMLIHPVKDPGQEEGMRLLKGVTPTLKEGMGLEMKSGNWFSDPHGQTGEVVIFGYEAAEFEQRHVGDQILLPVKGKDVTATVIGILERTGTQMDGTTLLPVENLQNLYDMPGQLTGVGVRVDPSIPDAVTEIQTRYHAEPELQVVSLKKIEQALNKAMANMRDVVDILAWVLAIMAGAILLNTTLLRTLAEHKRFYVLHAIGLQKWFIYGSAFVENLLLVALGCGLGLVSAHFAGGWSTEILTGYLPYAPDGNLIALPFSFMGSILMAAIGLGIVATIPPLIRLAWFSDLSALRRG